MSRFRLRVKQAVIMPRVTVSLQKRRAGAGPHKTMKVSQCLAVWSSAAFSYALSLVQQGFIIAKYIRYWSALFKYEMTVAESLSSIHQRKMSQLFSLLKNVSKKSCAHEEMHNLFCSKSLPYLANHLFCSLAIIIITSCLLISMLLCCSF